ncbi:MAG: hypothetical protein J7515_08975, partial [Caulobacter sp.]|nr:hypothetical protein [Caulobacter sp.]
MKRQRGRREGRWAGGLVAGLLLAFAGPALALQATTAVPPVAGPNAPTAASTAPRTYAECLRSYAGRSNATAVCQRLFPNAATPSTTTAPASTDTPATTTPTREPVDITPQLNKLIEAWKN